MIENNFICGGIGRILCDVIHFVLNVFHLHPQRWQILPIVEYLSKGFKFVNMIIVEILEMKSLERVWLVANTL